MVHLDCHCVEHKTKLYEQILYLISMHCGQVMA